MRDFKGLKYQHGKIGADHSPTTPDSVELAKRLARKATVSSVVVNGEEMLYICIDLGKRNSYGHAYKTQVADNVREAFELQTGISVIVGFYDLKFSGITKKEAFKIKLGGTGK